MELFLAIFGTFVTVISFIYAVYTNRRHSRLINYNREQAWENYRQASNVLAMCQILSKIGAENKEIVSWVAKAEIQAKELTFNSIRMIKRFEKKYDPEAIDKWHQDGRLNHESHVQIFKTYIEK
jgi:glycosylphosphatidylinositol transamidase (GPIT) subunit GPI8